MRSYRRKNQKVSMTIEGVVALAEWSDNGESEDVVILTDDEEEFYVDMKDSAVKPAKYLNSRVEATGKIYERDGQTMLAVRRIRVLDEPGKVETGMEGENHFEDAPDYDFWTDDGIVDQYTRFVRGSRDFFD